MRASLPVHGEHDFGARFIDVCPDLFNDGTYDALLECHIGCGRVPDEFEIARQLREVIDAGRIHTTVYFACCIDPSFNQALEFESGIPALFEFTSDCAVLGIDSIELTLGAARLVLRLLQLELECFNCLVACTSELYPRALRRLDRGRSRYREHSLCDLHVHINCAERYALRIAKLGVPPVAGVATHALGRPAVVDAKTVTATPAGHEPREQRRAAARGPVSSSTLCVFR